MNLLNKRDGLMLGICNGFQALIKLGLVPYGEIRTLREDDPTLTYNTIGRHAATHVRTVVSSVKSPWMAGVNVGDVHQVAISHGEGRFVCREAQLKQLVANGQIVTQYCNLDGVPAVKMPENPNGSYWAVEGICSPDGRVLGKMGHSERIGANGRQEYPWRKGSEDFRVRRGVFWIRIKENKESRRSAEKLVGGTFGLFIGIDIAFGGFVFRINDLPCSCVNEKRAPSLFLVIAWCIQVICIDIMGQLFFRICGILTFDAPCRRKPVFRLISVVAVRVRWVRRSIRDIAQNNAVNLSNPSRLNPAFNLLFNPFPLAQGCIWLDASCFCPHGG